MDISGLTTVDDKRLASKIIDALLEANPDIDLVECLNMAKQYLHENYDINVEIIEVEDE